MDSRNVGRHAAAAAAACGARDSFFDGMTHAEDRGKDGQPAGYREDAHSRRTFGPAAGIEHMSAHEQFCR